MKHFNLKIFNIYLLDKIKNVHTLLTKCVQKF